MNYRQKRIASGISLYTMAKELGIDKNKYKEVESNNLSLTGDLLDKFMATLDRGKELNFNRLVKMKSVNEWLLSGQARKDMERMGYDQKSLAKALNCHYTYVCHALVRADASDDFKEELYDFLHNSLNKNLIVENKEGKKETKMLRRKKEKKNKVIVSDVLVSEPTTTTIFVDAAAEKGFKVVDVDKDARIKELELIVANREEEIKYLKETINRIFKI